MDILFVATELAPMVKVGGLADVVAALSKTLRMLGHRVTIALPRFPAIERSGVMVARRLTPLALPDGPEAVVFDGRLASGVELVLVDFPSVSRGPGYDSAPGAGEGPYDRPFVYGERGEGYPDNGWRFALFNRAVVEIIRQRAQTDQPFDVVHVHDWPTAMVPYLLKLDGALRSTATVLTIHNLKHQGLVDAGALSALGLGEEHFTPETLEFYGSVNFMKGGILAADALTTVSTTYAKEIQTKALGERLEGVLKKRKDQLSGIVNGLDYAVWSPATDPNLVARYDSEDPSNKGRSKSAFCREVGLEIAPDRPLIGVLGRLDAQKGTDIVASALPKLLRADVAIAIAGAGDPELEAAIRAAAEKAPGRAAYLGEIAEPQAHRLVAASDLLLMPSRFEPCGLVQLMAQRYGTLPIVTRTGGLVDTVVDVDAHLETGTGFALDKPTISGLVGAVGRAQAAMAHPRWGQLVRRVMRLDLGWERPARQYQRVYRDVLSRAG